MTRSGCDDGVLEVAHVALRGLLQHRASNRRHVENRQDGAYQPVGFAQPNRLAREIEDRSYHAGADLAVDIATFRPREQLARWLVERRPLQKNVKDDVGVEHHLQTYFPSKWAR